MFSISRGELGPNFVFGAATAAYQIEGGQIDVDVKADPPALGINVGKAADGIGGAADEVAALPDGGECRAFRRKRLGQSRRSQQQHREEGN